MSSPGPFDRPFQILAVCTGNVCRSPAVERLLRASHRDGSVRVTSAGSRALVGAPVDAEVARRLRAAGADDADFAARQLTPDLVARADLVLALTREHRSRVVTTLPAALRRTFTLREFARAATGVDPAPVVAAAAAQAWRDLVTEVGARRGMTPAAHPDDDDVVDPFRRDDAVHDRAFGQITDALDAVSRVTAPG